MQMTGIVAPMLITITELVPVVIAYALWGKESQGLTVEYRTDNAPVVAIVNSNRRKMPLAMHLPFFLHGPF